MIYRLDQGQLDTVQYFPADEYTAEDTPRGHLQNYLANMHIFRTRHESKRVFLWLMNPVRRLSQGSSIKIALSSLQKTTEALISQQQEFTTTHVAGQSPQMWLLLRSGRLISSFPFTNTESILLLFWALVALSLSRMHQLNHPQAQQPPWRKGSLPVALSDSLNGTPAGPKDERLK